MQQDALHMMPVEGKDALFNPQIDIDHSLRCATGRESIDQAWARHADRRDFEALIAATRLAKA